MLIPTWFKLLWNIILAGVAALSGVALVRGEWFILVLGLFLTLLVILVKSVTYALVQYVDILETRLQKIESDQSEIRQLQDYRYDYYSEGRKTINLNR